VYTGATWYAENRDWVEKLIFFLEKLQKLMAETKSVGVHTLGSFFTNWVDALQLQIQRDGLSDQRQYRKDTHYTLSNLTLSNTQQQSTYSGSISMPHTPLTLSEILLVGNTQEQRIVSTPALGQNRSKLTLLLLLLTRSELTPQAVPRE
jgi:hypothetical protein